MKINRIKNINIQQYFQMNKKDIETDWITIRSIEVFGIATA